MDIWIWMNELVASYGYAGAFAVCLVGNVSIVLPVPFALVVYAFGPVLDPLVLGVVAGVGSTIGEMSSYLLGRGGRAVIKRSHGNRLDAVRSLIDRHGMTAIFLAALLPIPDDLLLIPLGMMKYPVLKTVMAMLLGKIGMCLFLAYAGANSFTYFRDVYASGGDLGVALTIVLLVVIVIAVLRLDWVQLLENHAR